MQKYKSHKTVEAAKIDRIDSLWKHQLPPFKAQIKCKGLDAFTVSAEYMEKHKPIPGGYYVKYADGYESFSPAEAFEDGYTLVDAIP